MEENRNLEPEQTAIIENSEINDSLNAINEEISKKNLYVNKRIDFDTKTFKRLETMMPIYKDELKEGTNSEVYSYIVQKAVNALFEGDFKKRIDEL